MQIFGITAYEKEQVDRLTKNLFKAPSLKTVIKYKIRLIKNKIMYFYYRHFLSDKSFLFTIKNSVDHFILLDTLHVTKDKKVISSFLKDKDYRDHLMVNPNLSLALQLASLGNDKYEIKTKCILVENTRYKEILEKALDTNDYDILGAILNNRLCTSDLRKKIKDTGYKYTTHVGKDDFMSRADRIKMGMNIRSK
jgi:hypothetical protein